MLFPNDEINQITNSYYNGDITGTTDVGGIVGCSLCADITKNYSAATINGTTNVGGIAGKLDNGSYLSTNIASSLTSNVAINTSVNASSSVAGRIYGSYTDGSWTIGTLGSANTNKGLLTTAVTINGVAQTITETQQQGNTIGAATIKKKATYQGVGWDMTSDWNIQETESYPYKSWQTAPPIISSGATSGSTSITGKCVDNGTVYIEIGDKNYTATVSGNTWTATVDALQAGTQIRVYAKSATKAKSYSATSYVTFPGSGTAADPYQVITAEDLAGINGNGYYKLMNDLDLTSWISTNSPTAGWVPVGRNASMASNFDGDGHTISGLWTNTTDAYTGLFANASSATIKNLTVNVATGKTVKGGDYTAVLLGKGTNTTIKNCTVTGIVEGKNYAALLAGQLSGTSIVDSCIVSGTAKGSNYVAGISGVSEGTITNSKANVTVTSTGFAAALVAYTTAAVSGCKTSGDVTSTGSSSAVGGLVGVSESTITNCISSANATISGSASYAGGIAGTCEGDIKTSTSSGSIKATGESSYAGGVTAKAGVSGTSMSISDSYSTADVTGTAYVGGIAGYSYASITNCYSAGNLTCTGYGAGIVGYNDGTNAATSYCLALNPKIELTESTGTAKRVIGGYKNSAPDPVKENLYALKEMVLSVNGSSMTLSDNMLNGVAKSGNEFKQASFLTSIGWNMTDTWGVLELNSYPYLRMEKTASSETEKEDEGGSSVSTADYALSIDPLSTTSGQSVTLSVNMVNKNDINGFQFDIVLPEGISLQKNTKGKYIFNLGERCDDHTFSSQLQSDGSVRVVCTSLTNTCFEGNSGEVCQIPLTLDESLTNGTYKVSLKNVSLSDAESTDIEASNVEGVITILNDYMTSGTATGTVGKTFTLPLNMINKSTNITSFQVDVTMPTGISLATNTNGKYIITLNADRGDDHTFSTVDRGNNVVRVVCTSLSNSVFTGTEGALCEFMFTSASTVADGTYDISFTNISASNTNAVDIPMADTKGSVTLKSFTRGDVNNDGKISVADVTATISFVLGTQQSTFIFDAADMDASGVVKVNDVTSVISMVLTEGSSSAKAATRLLAKRKAGANTNTSKMYVEPFAIEPGETKNINIMLDNPELSAIGWQADVKLPEGLEFVKRTNGKYYTAINADRTDGYTISSQAQSDGSARVVGVNMDNDPIMETSGAIMTIRVKASDDIEAGIYNIELNNVSLSDESSNDVTLDNSKTSVFSGDLSAVKSMTLYGGWSSDAIDALNDKVAGNSVITSIDLSEALAMDNSATITTSNANTLIYLPSGMTLANTKNVVSGGTCDNLVVTDGASFDAPVDFTATAASYSHAMTNTWATICLPYEVKTDATVEYYKITNVSGGYLVLEKYETLPANTPALMKKLSGDAVSANAENVAVGGALADVIGTVTMKGSYANDTKVEDANAYYIYNDKFWRCNQYFYIDAFRAYFVVDANSAKPNCFTIGEEAVTALNALTGKSDVTVDAIYNKSGARMDSMQKGMNIVKFSDGKIQKILIK